jgi:hypothetical protein
MNAVARESAYVTLARLSGLTLIVVCVLFQRRGLLDWTELVFLGLCIGMQETFLRVHALRRLRTPMMVLYSVMPLALVLYHAAEIRGYHGDFVQIVLYTPLPLVLISVQIMVLYVRESSRLVSVVLVLALFSTVIGVRRPLDDVIWPWLAGVCFAATLFLMLQHPGMLFHGVYVARRRGALPPSGRPGGIMRAAYFSVLPMFAISVLLASLFLYVTVPRIEPQRSDGQGYEIGADPMNAGGGGGPTDLGRNPGNPRKPRDPIDSTSATISGLSSGVDLGDFGEIKRMNTPALDVMLTKPTGATVQRLYLRAFTYATFDGRRWAPLPTDLTTREVAAGEPRRLPGAPSRAGAPYEEREFRVTLKEAGVGALGQLPLPTEPFAISTYGDSLYYDSLAHTARAPLIGPGGVYVVHARQLTLPDDRLVERLADSAPAESPRPEYLQVPPKLKQEVRRRFNLGKEKFYDRFEAMVQRRSGGQASGRGVYAAARDIVGLFRLATTPEGKAWTYSLDARPAPGDDAIARFLDTGSPDAERIGHCEYFASAMCVLMRCYGVPARVCAGFFAQNPDANGNFEVRASAAHAWVEVYFDGWGWIAFDPTPPETDEAGGNPGETDPTDPGATTGPKPDPETPGEAVDAEGGGSVKTDWLQRYDREAQEEMFSGVRDFLADVKDRASEILASFTAWMPDVLPRSPVLRTLVLVLPVLLFAAALVWRRRRRRKIEAKVLEQMGEGGKRRQRSLYFQLLLLLAGYGFQKRASETPREFATRVLRKGGIHHEPILELTELYYGLRFGLEASLEHDFKAALAKYSDRLRGLDRAQRSASSDSGPQPQPG